MFVPGVNRETARSSPCWASSSQPARASDRRISSMAAWPPTVELQSRATIQASARSESALTRFACSRAASRVHELGVAARKRQQRLVRQASVRVGAAEAPRPRAGIPLFQCELEVLLQRRRRRRRTARRLPWRIAGKLSEQHFARHPERRRRQAVEIAIPLRATGIGIAVYLQHVEAERWILPGPEVAGAGAAER